MLYFTKLKKGKNKKCGSQREQQSSNAKTKLHGRKSKTYSIEANVDDDVIGKLRRI